MTGNEAEIDVQEEGGEWDLFKASHEQLLITTEQPSITVAMC